MGAKVDVVIVLSFAFSRSYQYSPVIFLSCRLGSLRCYSARSLPALHLHQNINPMHMTEQKMADFECLMWHLVSVIVVHVARNCFMFF